MNDVLEVLTYNILPIFLVATIGFWLRRGMGLDKKSVSTVVFNGLSPCLVFTSLVNSQLPGSELVRLALFAALTILLMGFLGLLVGWLLRLSRTSIVALVLVLMFVNGGNYGMTLNHLRYGEEGLARAVIYFVVSTVIVFTIGVFIASMGRANWQATLARLVRLPPFYAVIFALLVYGTGLQVPLPIMRGIEVAASGAIPAMLIVLGMQMADLQGLSEWRLAVPAVILRLVVAPLMAVLVAEWLLLEGLSRSVSIIEASTPTAVMVTILATEFDVQPAAVTTIVVLSTLFSIVTLPLVIALFAL